jgi:hypothetical protein
MNIHAIKRFPSFPAQFAFALSCMVADANAQSAPAPQSPDIAALIDRAAIENLIADYHV